LARLVGCIQLPVQLGEPLHLPADAQVGVDGRQQLPKFLEIRLRNIQRLGNRLLPRVAKRIKSLFTAPTFAARGSSIAKALCR